MTEIIHIKFKFWRRILILFGVSIRMHYPDGMISRITIDQQGDSHIYLNRKAKEDELD